MLHKEVLVVKLSVVPFSCRPFSRTVFGAKTVKGQPARVECPVPVLLNRNRFLTSF